ncbi:AT hook containing transcription factor 1, partial [Elysia marginata]
ELESVCPRLDHNLTVDAYSGQPSGTTRSTMICCYTLQNPQYTPPAVLSESFDDGFHGNDSSLGIFVWRADGKQSGRGSVTSRYWLSIFDINRWYHAQMPHAMRCHGASLQVYVRFVMADGAIQAKCHGWQRSLLRELMANGAEYLVQPADFYHQCLRARLLPQSFEESKTRST